MPTASSGAPPSRPTCRSASISAPTERTQLVAFLNTLSSNDPPRPAGLPPKAMAFGTDAEAVATSTVSQKDRRFTPTSVLLKVGEALRILNDDIRVHNVRLDGPDKSFNSDAQNPGDTVTIGFDRAGRYDVICGIHPEMRLSVTVLAPSTTEPAQNKK